MSSIILLISCLLIGFILRKFNIVPTSSSASLNALIINVFIPAVTLRYGVELNFSYDILLPILAAWLVFIGSYVFFIMSREFIGLDRKTIGALIVVSGISSISFLGFPIFELCYGIEGLKAGIIMSQAGTFVICSTAGIMVSGNFASEKGALNLTRIFRFPPFIFFSLALLLNIIGYTHGDSMKIFLEKLSSPLSMIALLSIGLQMEFAHDANLTKPLLLGLGYKLLIAPTLVFSIYALFFDMSNIYTKVSILGSGLGSMATIGVIAIEYGLNPPLVTKLIGYSIPLSLLVIPIIYWILQGF
jgi:malate permease and related proteins